MGKILLPVYPEVSAFQQKFPNSPFCLFFNCLQLNPKFTVFLTRQFSYNTHEQNTLSLPPFSPPPAHSLSVEEILFNSFLHFVASQLFAPDFITMIYSHPTAITIIKCRRILDIFGWLKSKKQSLNPCTHLGLKTDNLQVIHECVQRTCSYGRKQK